MSSVSVRLYLKNGIEENPLLKRKYPDDWNSEYSLNGVKIIHREYDELFYHPMDLLEDCFPVAINEFIEKISLRANIKISNPRRSGRYLYLTAEGFVEGFSCNEQTLIVLTGPNFDDAKNLYFKILRGEIFPYEDWEGKQVSDNSNIAKSLFNMFYSMVNAIKNKLIKVRG